MSHNLNGSAGPTSSYQNNGSLSASQDNYDGILLNIQSGVQRFVTYGEEGDTVQLTQAAQELTIHLHLVRNISNYENNLQKKNALDSLCSLLCLLLSCYYDSYSENADNTENPMFHVQSIYSGRPGRPALSVDVNVIQQLHNLIGLSWTEISRKMGVSLSTLKRRKAVLPAQNTLDDAQLFHIIHECRLNNPNCGARYIQGRILSRGYRVPRRRVREALRRFDPHGTILSRRVTIVRRKYRNRGPDALWHLDGNDKINQFGFHVHGCTDGFSRYIIYLECCSNKTALCLLEVFRKAVHFFGLPSRVRSDKGNENVLVGDYMIAFGGAGRGSIITGRSIHNIRIERLWGEVNAITDKFKQVFLHLEESERLDVDDPRDIVCLHYVFTPLINRDLNLFISDWDYHKMDTANGRSPISMYFGATSLRKPTPDDSQWTPPAENLEDEEAAPNDFDHLKDVFLPHLERELEGTLPSLSMRSLLDGVTLYLSLRQAVNEAYPQQNVNM